MNTQRTSRHIIAALFAAVIATWSLAPTPANASVVSLIVSTLQPLAVSPASLVTFSGSGGAPGAPVTLQRQYNGVWTSIAHGTLDGLGQFTFRVPVAAGPFKYRTVTGNSYSEEQTVAGTYLRSRETPLPNEKFNVTARVPGGARVVSIQVAYRGKWYTRGVGSSTASGLATVRTYVSNTSVLRMYAQKTSSSPAWAGPAVTVSTYIDPAVKRILDDTNARRASVGLAPLQLNSALNNIATTWAKKMHDGCFFYHNSYSQYYPSGWKKAAENIAAGQQYTDVVTTWWNSPGHKKNMLGDYNQIGIGVYNGPNCYKRYYVQNFGKY